MRLLLRTLLPSSAYNALRLLRRPGDLVACALFVAHQYSGVSWRDRLRIVKQLYVIQFSVESPHTQEEMLSYIHTILSLPPDSKDVVVEAGCYKGSSTAKLSLAADLAGRELVVFDSFQGIPDNDEQHDRNIFGGVAAFQKGSFCGTLAEVERNVEKFGKIRRCRFVPGWFDDTLPRFNEPIAAIYLDVDLATSTRTCLKYLYPLLKPGGTLYSQDGHLPLVVAVLNDEQFWVTEVGCGKPRISGLGERKLVKIVKEHQV